MSSRSLRTVFGHLQNNTKGFRTVIVSDAAGGSEALVVPGVKAAIAVNPNERQPIWVGGSEGRSRRGFTDPFTAVAHELWHA